MPYRWVIGRVWVKDESRGNVCRYPRLAFPDSHNNGDAPLASLQVCTRLLSSPACGSPLSPHYCAKTYPLSPRVTRRRQMTTTQLDRRRYCMCRFRRGAFSKTHCAATIKSSVIQLISFPGRYHSLCLWPLYQDDVSMQSI
jgi:hypothetical protein